VGDEYKALAGVLGFYLSKSARGSSKAGAVVVLRLVFLSGCAVRMTEGALPREEVRVKCLWETERIV
jgi:hypothetical protein